MDLSTFVWLFLVLLAVTVVAICLIERHEKRCEKRRDTDELRWTRVEAGGIL